MPHTIYVREFGKKGVINTYLRTCAISKSARKHIWKTCQPPASAEISRDLTLLQALGIDKEPLFGEEIQIDDGETDGDYAPVYYTPEVTQLISPH